MAFGTPLKLLVVEPLLPSPYLIDVLDKNVNSLPHTTLPSVSDNIVE